MTVLTPAREFAIDEHTYDSILHDLMKLKANEKLKDKLLLGGLSYANLVALPNTALVTPSHGHVMFKETVTHLSAQTHKEIAGDMYNPRVKKNPATGDYVVNPHNKQVVDTNQQVDLYGILYFYIPNGGCTAEDLKDTYLALASMSCRNFVMSEDFSTLFPKESLNSILRATFGQDGTRFGVWMADNGLLEKRYSYYPNNRVPSTPLTRRDVNEIFGEYPFISSAIYSRRKSGKKLDIPNYFSAMGFFKEIPIGNDSHTFWISSHLQGKIYEGEVDNFFKDGDAKTALEDLVTNFVAIQKANPQFADFLVTGGYNVALQRYCLESEGDNWVALFNEENGHVFLKTFHKAGGPRVRKNKFNDHFDYCMSMSKGSLMTIWNDSHRVTHLNQKGVEYILYANTLKGYPSPIGDAPSISIIHRIKGSQGKWNMHRGKPIAYIPSEELYGLYDPAKGKITDLIKYDSSLKDVVEIDGFRNIVPIQDKDEPYLSPTGEAPFVNTKGVIKNLLPAGQTHQTHEADKLWGLQKIDAFLNLYSDEAATPIIHMKNPASLKMTEVAGTSLPVQFIKALKDMVEIVKKKHPTANLATAADLYSKQLVTDIESAELDLEIAHEDLAGLTPQDSGYDKYKDDLDKAEKLVETLKKEEAQVKAILRSEYLKQLKNVTNTTAPHPNSNKQTQWPTTSDFSTIYNNVAFTFNKSKKEYDYHYNPDPQYHNLFHALMHEGLSIQAFLMTKRDEYNRIMGTLTPQTDAYDVAQAAYKKYDKELEKATNSFFKAVKTYYSEDLDIANPESILSYTNDYEKSFASHGYPRQDVVDFREHTIHNNKFKLDLDPNKKPKGKTASKQIRLATIIRLIRNFMV